MSKAMEPIAFDDSTIRVGCHQDQEVLIPQFSIVDDKRMEENFFPTLVSDNTEDYILNDDWQPKKEYLSDIAIYSYQQGLGKACAKVVEVDAIMKTRESNVESHQHTEDGFVRTRQFADGFKMLQFLTRNCFCGGKKWKYRGDVYFSLFVKPVAGGECRMTPICKLSDADKDDFAERILVRFLDATDTRAYRKNALKDLRSAILQFVDRLSFEPLPDYSGWSFESSTHFFDGHNFPLPNSIMSTLHVPRVQDCDLRQFDRILYEITNELRNRDETLSFALSYGLFSWLGRLFGYNLTEVPGLLITGERFSGLEVTSSFLKIYSIHEKPDYVDVSNLGKLDEYVDVLQDDCAVILLEDCSKKAMQVSKRLISNKCIGNSWLRTPLVVLDSWPHYLHMYENFVCIDVEGIRLPEKMKSNLQLLKLNIIKLFSNLNSKPENKRYYISLDKSINTIISELGSCFLASGIDDQICRQFCFQLLKGMTVLKFQPQFADEIPLYAFRQKIRNFIHRSRDEILLMHNEYFVMEIQGDRCLIASNYFHRCLLPNLRISESQWRDIRNMMLSKGLLECYENGEFTRQITLHTGKRIRVVDMDNAFFEICLEGGMSDASHH